jgi:hypothetical protein
MAIIDAKCKMVALGNVAAVSVVRERDRQKWIPVLPTVALTISTSAKMPTSPARSQALQRGAGHPTFTHSDHSERLTI